MTGIQRGTSLTEQMRDLLLDRITNDAFTSGVIYSVSDLSAQLGISRTPVREAVLQLQELGILETVKNKGFRVIEITDSDIVSAFQVRHALEPIAARISSRTIPQSTELQEQLRATYDELVDASQRKDQVHFMESDKRFHDQLLEAAGNSHLQRAVTESRDATYRRGVFTRTPTRSWDALNREHEMIMRAVLAGDSTAAAEHMRTHIQITGEYYLQKLGHPITEDWLLDY